MSIRSLVFAIAVSCLAAASASAQRLPDGVAPDHYDLGFDVDLANARFAGTETIKVRLTQPSRRIVLNALDIAFEEVTIDAAGSTQKASVTLNAGTETAALVVARAIPAGPAEIHIRYTGILNDKLRGFYLSTANGRRYAVTQMESTDARRAFPSFDEPAFKATFTLTLTIDRADTAISNGSLLSDVPGPGANRHTLSFSESPKMSSYLVAMAVGDFQCLGDSTDGIPIRICATPDKREMGAVALDAAKQILSYYNGYYAIRYPFKKLDVVAVPDFAAGAMENTAAIFYREVDLLTDAKTASLTNRKRIWSVLAHEMAHQWFGDLVTMQWWDDLWLNEGFATWMEKRPLAALRPEWKMELDEMADTHRAMNLDGLASTRAIHSPVETPAAIEGSFDTIAYEKGAAVMRMVEGFLGPDRFRTGVNAYLEHHAYANATSQDFWSAMTATSGEPIDKILPTFVNQPGVPLLAASTTCIDGHPTVSLSSDRFFVDRAGAGTAAGRTGWQIPVCVKTSDKAPRCDVISGQKSTIPLPDASCGGWAFINAGAQGYFRTAYSREMLAALAPRMADALSEAERLSLLGDEWALVRASRHTVADYLTLAGGLGQEHSSGVMAEVGSRLGFIHDYLTTDVTRLRFEQFVQHLLNPLFDELSLDASPADSDDRRALRSSVIATLDEAGNDGNLSAAAQTAFERAFYGGAALDATSADATLSVAARRGDTGLWQRLSQASQSAESPSERYRYLYALTSFQNPVLIDRGLTLTLTAQIRSQDTPSFLGRFLGNPAARARTWSFVKDHWTELAPKITISLGDVRLVESLGGFCDASSRDDIKAFFTAHPLPAASRALDQTLERINNCISVRTQQGAALSRWLDAR